MLSSSLQNGTFCNFASMSGSIMIHPVKVVKTNIKAYMIRVEVEFRHEGHAEQQSEHAAEEQQQASWPTVKTDSNAPILNLKNG